jgi:hypothetical protein
MSRRVKEDATLLKALTPKERKALLKTCGNDRIKSICECAYNVLRGNVPLSPKQKRQLRKHKQTLRRLVKRGECWSKKRQYLVQRGGGILIPLLLNAVLPTILRAVTTD